MAATPRDVITERRVIERFVVHEFEPMQAKQMVKITAFLEALAALDTDTRQRVFDLIFEPEAHE